MDFDGDNLNKENVSQAKPWGMEENQFCMLMHLAQLASFVIPIAGFVLPIVMWATNKDISNKVDEHGKNILNWIISYVIYGIISALLVFLLVGVFLLIVLAILGLVFSIIGAVKANDGVVYKYPLAITFIK